MLEIRDALFKMACAAREKSYSPYSGFKVGAAILTESGQIFPGTNIEEATYKSICAEASAIACMVSQSGREIIKEVLVVAGEEGDGSLVTPCGHCRQYLREHAGSEMIIHIAGPEGIRKSLTLSELLPYSFGPEDFR